MTAVLSLLVVLTLSFLTVRLFTIALSLTGVSKTLARFQALSAFTGVGFTTTESEHIVSHPVRRRLVMLLMVLGSAGFVTAASTLILSFVGIGRTGDVINRSALLLGGIVLLILAARSGWIEGRLDRLIRWSLARWTRLEALDLIDLLRLHGDYGIHEMTVEGDDWVAGRRLDESELFQEGVSVLGIHRDDRYLAVPRGETEVRAGDRLVLYGHAERLGKLEDRKAGTEGDQDHARAVRSQVETRRAQEAQEATK